MILSKVYEDAENRLERNEITLGEFERLVDIEVIKPKRGEWIEFDTKWGRSLYYCTNCMETSEVPTAFGKPLYDFCPACGADMRGKDDDSDNI